MSGQMVREAVAVFHSVEDLEAAIDELLVNGFDRAELSLLAGEETVREKLGHGYGDTAQMEDDPGAPSVPYLARESFGSLEGYAIGLPLYVGAVLGMIPVVASGGAVAAAIAATALGGGAGAAIGGVLAHLIGRRHAEFLENQLAKGGILLWVRTRDVEHERRATRILARHAGDDVHVHGIPDRGPELARRYEPPARHAVYRDIELIVAGDGHSLVLGRLFVSETEARRYVDLVQGERYHSD